jgi:hypothetical protein
MVLAEGHETVATTSLDAELDEILDMPSDSALPITLALALSGIFVMLLLGHWTTALVFLGLSALIVAAWHLHEPQEA